MITVDSLSILNSLKIKEIGDTAYVTKEQKVYEYTEGGWVPKALPQGKINLSVYDMNKQIISQLGAADDITLLTPVRKFKNKGGKYFMLICRDINYYTLFTVDEDGEERIEREVLNCVKDIGELRSAEEIDGTEAIEIWIQPKEEYGTDPLVMYFFNYDKGVIVCR
jgi:hypothetical protein